VLYSIKLMYSNGIHCLIVGILIYIFIIDTYYLILYIVCMKKHQNTVNTDDRLKQARRAASIVLENAATIIKGVQRVNSTQHDEDRALTIKSVLNALDTASLALWRLEKIANSEPKAKDALEAASASFENARDALSLIQAVELSPDSKRPSASSSRVVEEHKEIVHGLLKDIGISDPEGLFRNHRKLVENEVGRVMAASSSDIKAKELEEEGVQALFLATYSWRMDKGGDFESYARKKISDAISKKIESSNDIKPSGGPKDNRKKLKSLDFENALKQKLKSAQEAGKESLTIVAKELHNEVVEQINADYKYPGQNHRIPACCSVMRKYKRDGDSDNGKRISPLLEVTYKLANQEFVTPGSPESFEQVWELIKEHEGELFYTKTGKEFTYQVDGDGVIPSRTPWRIPKSNFRLYYDRGPVNGPAGFRRDDLKKVQGPSYLWGIMRDDRIRPKKWPT